MFSKVCAVIFSLCNGKVVEEGLLMEEKVCLIHVAWTNLEIIGKSFMVMNGEPSLKRESTS